MTRLAHSLLAGLSAGALLAPAALAQPQGEVGRYSDVTIEGTVLEPRPITVSDDDRLVSNLRVADGFALSVFARDLVNPRMLALSPRGDLYATRRSVGDVVLIRDGDGDGRAEEIRTVASRPGMHGIAFDGERVFLATVNDIYTAELQEDGGFGDLTRIIDDLPDAGQHPNRTLAIGPDDRLYISVGSTCNACDESNPENAALLSATKDGAHRSIFASGLRNTIGFGWQPDTGILWGFDHGIDWLGDAVQVEELNRITQGARYGWPYVYGMGEFNPQDDPPEGISLADWAAGSENPVLGHTAHAAPMQMAFAAGPGWPADLRGDAFVAMRGSWNRRPPSGYELVRVDFEDGAPRAIEPVVSNFLLQQEDGSWGYLGRPTGVAAAPDGTLYLADESNGIVYRLTRGDGASAEATGAVTPAAVPDTAPDVPAGGLAKDAVAPENGGSLDVTTASFAADAAMPDRHAAEGENASPPLSWSGAPEGTRSFAIVMDDPDAGMPMPFTHWIVYDIPADVTSLREGLPTAPILPVPEGVKQGVNTRGSVGYYGPRPPVGDDAHAYHIQVFALDRESLDLQPGADRASVLAAMDGHVLAVGDLVGRYARTAEAAR